MDLKDKNAVVIGGVSGIGLVCVKEFMKNGVKKVIIIDYNEEIFDKTLKEIEDEFGAGKVSIYKADIINAPEFEAVFKKVIDEVETIDILLCNAGIVSEVIWRTVIDVNVTGTIHGLLMGLDHMSVNKGGKGGVIILTASAMGLRGSPDSPIYSASKHAVVGLARSFGDKVYFDVSGVRVMAQCPGSTNTKILLGENLYEKPATFANHQHQRENVGVVAKQEPPAVAEGIVYMIKNGNSGAIYVTRESKTYEVDMPSFSADTYKMKRVL